MRLKTALFLLVFVLPLGGCEWWNSSSARETLMPIARTIESDSKSLEAELAEWRLVAEQIAETAETEAEQNALKDLQDVISTGEDHLVDLSTSAGLVADKISESSTNGELALTVAGTVLGFLGVPGGFVLREMGKRSTVKQFAGNIANARMSGADDQIVLDKNIFKTENIKSGLQPLIKKITG